MFSVTNAPSLEASLYTDFLQVNNSFDVCPIVVKIISLWVRITETEKMAICQHHCKSKGLNPGLYISLSFTKANHMFPFLCKVFALDEKYQRLGESFFNKPFA
jgi:hypothetical protein